MLEPQPIVLSHKAVSLSEQARARELDAAHTAVLRSGKRRPGATPAGRRSPAAVPGGVIGRATEGALGTPFTTECTTASARCALLLRKINAACAKRPIVGVDSSVESLASPGGSLVRVEA